MHARRQPSHSIGPGIEEKVSKSWCVHPEALRNSNHVFPHGKESRSAYFVQPKALRPPQSSSVPIHTFLACARVLETSFTRYSGASYLHIHTQAYLTTISQQIILIFDCLAIFCCEFHAQKGAQQQPGARPQCCWFHTGGFEGSHVEVDLETWHEHGQQLHR